MKTFIIAGGSSSERDRYFICAMEQNPDFEVIYLCHRKFAGGSGARYPHDVLPCRGVHVGTRQFHRLGALKAVLDTAAGDDWILMDASLFQIFRIGLWARRRNVPLEISTSTPRMLGHLRAAASRLGRKDETGVPPSEQFSRQR